MWCALILLSAAFAAQTPDRPADRKAIVRAIADLNQSNARPSAGRQVWSETFPAFLDVKAIRFVSRDEAIVEAVETRIGGMTLKQTWPVELVMKRERGRWRVAGYRPALPPP